MAGQYRTIQGIKYERDLLEYAERAKSIGREMTTEDAERLYTMAMDGNRVTVTERRTLEYIMERFSMDDAGKKCLQAKLSGAGGARLQRGGTGYYKYIDGISYDRALLEEGMTLAEANGGVLTFKNAVHLHGKASDGRGITECEKRTLKLICEGCGHRLEGKATEFFEEALDIKLTPALTDRQGPSRASGGASSSRSGGLALQDGSRASAGGAVPSRAGPSAEKASEDTANSNPGFFASVWNSLFGKRGREPSPDKNSSAGYALEDNPARASDDQDAKKRRVGDKGAQSSVRGSPASTSKSAQDELSEELKQLLSQMSGGDTLALEMPAEAPKPPAEDPEVLAQKAKAATEVNRILAAKNAKDVLGGGSKEEQKKEWMRLCRLLHPDKGYVNPADERANLAMRLVTAAWNRQR